MTHSAGTRFGRDDTPDVKDLDLLEINEAFAGVALATMRDLGVSADRVNVNGGAIALGHPVGMSGARLVLTLAMELRRRDGGTGAAALCGGGGQGDAVIVRARRAARPVTSTTPPCDDLGHPVSVSRPVNA